ncbi:MAG: hypothetical protein RX318_03915 [bacterium]|nr:hypothetical protein [bacterium]
MAAIGTLVVDLKANTAGFQRDMKRGEGTIRRFTKFAIGAGVALAARSAVSAAIKAAAQQEAAEAKLAQALSNVAGVAPEAVDELKKYAAELQNLTGIGDEVIIDAQAMLATFQLNAEAIKILTVRVLDMATIMDKGTGSGVDLQATALAIGKAMTGTAGILSRYGVVLTKVQTEQLNTTTGMEKVRVLAEALDSNFKGLAEAMGRTTVGEIRKMNSAWSDLQETLGKSLFLKSLTLLVKDLALALDSVAKKAQAAGQGLAKHLAPILRALGFNVFVRDLTEAKTALAGLKPPPAVSKIAEELEKLKGKAKDVAFQTALMQFEIKNFDSATVGATKQAIEYARGLGLVDEQLSFSKEALDDIVELARNFAAEKNMSKELEAIAERAAQVKDAADAVGQAFGTALERIIIDAQDAREVVASLLRDIARAVLQAAVIKPLVAGISGGITGGLGGLFAARRHGGPVAAGQPFIVGESGRELFVPAQAGQIIPEGRGRGGGGPTFIYNIDARGAGPGVETEIIRALKAIEERAVNRAVLTVQDTVLRGGRAAKAFGR